ncbi:MAG: YbaN family protein [Peptostreptococcaceae bacterium]|nr:YbaN family protein [Peptostreptococcaceae bacterium]
MEKYSVKKIVFLIVGLIGLALGAVGAVIPLMPAFPFLMLAAICFAKSSDRLNDWFIQTKLYKNNLESYVEGKGMTMKTKVRIIAIVTLTMAFGFMMMSKVPVGRIILGIVWVFHILYFMFGIKTIPSDMVPAAQESDK